MSNILDTIEIEIKGKENKNNEILTLKIPSNESASTFIKNVEEEYKKNPELIHKVAGERKEILPGMTKFYKSIQKKYGYTENDRLDTFIRYAKYASGGFNAIQDNTLVLKIREEYIDNIYITTISDGKKLRLNLKEQFLLSLMSGISHKSYVMNNYYLNNFDNIKSVKLREFNTVSNCPQLVLIFNET